MELMSPEERAKEELIMKEREEWQAQKKAKDAEKKRLEEKSMKLRKEKQEEIHTENAKANKITYGANVVKFEPPKNQGG